MHCVRWALKRKVEKPLLSKETLKSRFTCLACQHFSFDAKKSLDRERPFSLALRVVSLFSCLSRLAPSVTRVAICVFRVLLDGPRKKRLLVVYFTYGTTYIKLFLILKRSLKLIDQEPHCILTPFSHILFANLVPRSHSVLHWKLAVGDLGTRLTLCSSLEFLVAQWLEHPTTVWKVVGSIPI